jgi:DNA-binding CsgD family transcriptional regulator
MAGSPEDPSVARTMMWAAHNIVLTLVGTGEYERARFFHDWSEARAQEVGWGRWLHVHECNGVLLDWATGEWQDLGERARHLCDTQAGTYAGGVGNLVGGLLSLAVGQVDDAEAALGSVVAMDGKASSVAPALAGLGRVHLEHGRPMAAIADLTDFMSPTTIRLGALAGVGEVLRVAVEVLAASDRTDDAEWMTRDVESELGGCDAPLARACVTWSWGVIAEHQGRNAVAADLFARAESEFAEMPRPYDAARAAERRGVCLLAESDPRAAVCLVDALRRLRRLGATGDERRVRRFLRAHRISVPKIRSDRMAVTSPLTPREQEVVGLASRGHTGLEISQALSLSPRTVEQYLRFALRKLGLDRKRDLVGHAAVEAP